MQTNGSLFAVPSLGLFSLYLFVLSNSDVLDFIYLIILILRGFFPLDVCFLLMRDRKGVDSDGGEVGRNWKDLQVE